MVGRRSCSHGTLDLSSCFSFQLLRFSMELRLQSPQFLLYFSDLIFLCFQIGRREKVKFGCLFICHIRLIDLAIDLRDQTTENEFHLSTVKLMIRIIALTIGKLPHTVECHAKVFGGTLLGHEIEEFDATLQVADMILGFELNGLVEAGECLVLVLLV